MSCPNGVDCNEPIRRRRALLMLGLMMMVFIVLSGFSFLDSRDQITPEKVSFGRYLATDGKMVFQAYNCMGCHTVVGNGAYFAPDLTKEYQNTGPAWLAAFLPSAGGWPTEAAVKIQLRKKEVVEAAGVDSIEEYYKKYPGAKERVERRGGQTTYMPNLPLTGEEVNQMIAFLKYTSEMNTEGWPPEVKITDISKRIELLHGKPVFSTTVSSTINQTVAETVPENPAELGKILVENYNCQSCHSLQDKKIVGPGWGGLYGSQVKLTDGRTVVADDAYLAESITNPDATIVDGYKKGLMTSYDFLSDDDVSAIVAFIKNLEKR